MSGRSPIDSLRRLSPVTDSDAGAVFGTAGCEELLAGLTDLPFGRPRAGHAPPRHRRRRLVLAFAVIALAAIATAATWAALRGGPARETTSVQCLIGKSDAVIPSTSGNPARDCAVDYRREFGTGAPRLAAYDNGLGGVTVIPRGEKPQAGWIRLVGGQDVDLIQLQDSLDDYVNGLNSSCFGNGAAKAVTEARLVQFGFTGWTVSVREPASPATKTPNPTATSASRGAKPAPAESTSGTKTCVGGSIVDPTTESVTLGSGPVATGPKTVFEKLAAKLQPLTKSCESLPAAVSSVRATASTLGLSESTGPMGYDLNRVEDNSMRCASIYETVGGTIFLTVRGPHG
jgi:hypothetical protein